MVQTSLVFAQRDMLRDKTPSDKYRPKRYCCGEMLRAVLNGSYPLSRIPGAVLPAPIQPVVQCFVPGLAEVEAQKALRKTAKRTVAAAETADGERAPDSATSPEKRERAEEAPERSAKAVEAERQRTIVDDVKCGMCGHVVEDLWTYAGSHAHTHTHTHTPLLLPAPARALPCCPGSLHHKRFACSFPGCGRAYAWQHLAAGGRSALPLAEFRS